MVSYRKAFPNRIILCNSSSQFMVSPVTQLFKSKLKHFSHTTVQSANPVSITFLYISTLSHQFFFSLSY